MSLLSSLRSDVTVSPLTNDAERVTCDIREGVALRLPSENDCGDGKYCNEIENISKF